MNQGGAGRSLSALGSFYYVYFGLIGIVTSYFPLYLSSEGFTEQKIGFLIGAISIAKLVAPSIWGALADRFGVRHRLIQAGLGLAALSLLLLTFANGFMMTLGLIGCFSVFWTGILGVIESLTLDRLGQNQSRYGRIRACGSIGYVSAILLAGWWLQYHEPGSIAWILVAMGVVVFLLAFAIKDAPNFTEQPPLRTGFWKSVWQSPECWLFLLLSMLIHGAFAPYYAFFSLYSQQLGYSTFETSTFWTLGVLLEIGVFLLLPWLYPKLGRFWLALIALSVMTLRWILTPLAGDQYWLQLAVQGLHALNYAPLHCAMVFWAQAIFARYPAQGQSLYNGFAHGIGGFMGAYLAGIIWQASQPAAIFWFAAVLSGLGGLVLCVAQGIRAHRLAHSL